MERILFYFQDVFIFFIWLSRKIELTPPTLKLRRVLDAAYVFSMKKTCGRRKEGKMTISMNINGVQAAHVRSQKGEELNSRRLMIQFEFLTDETFPTRYIARWEDANENDQIDDADMFDMMPYAAFLRGEDFYMKPITSKELNLFQSDISGVKQAWEKRIETYNDDSIPKMCEYDDVDMHHLYTNIHQGVWSISEKTNIFEYYEIQPDRTRRLTARVLPGSPDYITLMSALNMCMKAEEEV